MTAENLLFYYSDRSRDLDPFEIHNLLLGLLPGTTMELGTSTEVPYAT